jgi:hypothetical protein
MESGLAQAGYLPQESRRQVFTEGCHRPVWEAYRIPAQWRSKRGEGVIDGKRCGVVTQNIGPAAFRNEHQQEARACAEASKDEGHVNLASAGVCISARTRVTP